MYEVAGWGHQGAHREEWENTSGRGKYLTPRMLGVHPLVTSGRDQHGSLTQSGGGGEGLRASCRVGQTRPPPEW